MLLLSIHRAGRVARRHLGRRKNRTRALRPLLVHEIGIRLPLGWAWEHAESLGEVPVRHAGLLVSDEPLHVLPLLFELPTHLGQELLLHFLLMPLDRSEQGVVLFV